MVYKLAFELGLFLLHIYVVSILNDDEEDFVPATKQSEIDYILL